MKDLSKISSWTKSFGLLPIHLNCVKKENKFLMLNGGYGDFCLEISNDQDKAEEYFSQSWSSNTKNFVVVNNDKVKVFNWINQQDESIPKKYIEDNSEKFYNYLLSRSFKTENDIVPYVLDVFKSLRNITQEKNEPSQALNLLYVLLISIEEDYGKIDIDKWKINEFQIPNGFEYYVEQIRNGFRLVKPQLNLILSHTSGYLFQEAHKEVLYFNPQINLFGGISSDLKSSKGLYSSIHYTPQFLARTIVENSITHIDLTKKTLKIFDPACGASEFLIETLKQLKEKEYKGNISILGWDTSITAVNTSKFLLQYEKRTKWPNGKIDFAVKLVEDSLLENWESDFDLIVMNPPFVSWELLNNKDSRNAVRDTFGSYLKSGKPNQASAFFYKAVQSLGKNGVLGCILPSSILSFETYKELRNNILDVFNPLLIGKLGNFVFEDALTDVSFIIGKKPKSQHVPKLLWTRNEKGNVQDALRDLRKMNLNNLFTVEKKNYSIYEPSKFPITSENWKILSIKENNLLKDIERYVSDSSLERLGKIFTVKQGIRQGKKDVFKITLAEYNTFEDSEKRFFRPVIDNSSVKNGQLFIKSYLWYPYNKEGMIFKNENDLAKSRYFLSHIKLHEEELRSRAGIKEWWGHTRPRNWQFEKEPKLVSTEFGKSDSFAFDKEGIFVVERGNAWFPKKEFELDDYYFYLALFTSNLFDKLLPIYSKQLAGGKWYDLGAKYTKLIPIPDVHSDRTKFSSAYTKLIELGKELEIGNSFVKPVIDEVLNSSFYPEISF